MMRRRISLTVPSLLYHPFFFYLALPVFWDSAELPRCMQLRYPGVAHGLDGPHSVSRRMGKNPE